MDHNEFRERYQYDSEKDLLGQGGFGRVYRARDVLLDRCVALKIFSREVPQQYNLISEIRRAIDLNHRNICKYYGAELLRGTNALGEAQVIQVGVMELVPGGTVDEFLKRRPEHREQLLVDVLQGLSYLHQRQPSIIHRDLKPPNVLVGFEDGVPVAKLADFAISKLASGSGVDMSQVGVGTSVYMAPEQLNPVRYGVNGKIQCNLDLWSFGAMTIELLTGKLPFGGGAASTGEILESIVRGVPAEVLDTFEEPYRSVLRRCMIQDAGKRAQSADELLRLFDPASHVPDRNRKETVVENARSRVETVLEEGSMRWKAPASDDTTPERTVPVFAPVEADSRKLPRRAWVALAILAIAAVCAVWALTQWHPDAEQTQTPSTQPPTPADSTPTVKMVLGKLEEDPSTADEHRAVALFKQKRFSEAAPLLERACNAGNLTACVNFGVMYDHGQGVSQDYTRATSLYSKACDAGNAEGCRSLGVLYEHGSGVSQDYSRAADLYSKACDAKVPDGCTNLGVLYGNGQGVAQDDGRALALFSKGCEENSALGCSDLGYLYENGRGTDKDLEKARQFYTKACSLGEQPSCNQLKSLQ